MSESVEWPTPSGPYSGNAAFEGLLAPPLEARWEAPLTAKENDGLAVGGGGKVLIPMHGTDVECRSLEDGKVLWKAPQVRRQGQRVFLAGDYAWAMRGGDADSGYEASCLELESGRLKVLSLSLVPQGIVGGPGEALFLQRDEAVRLENLTVMENPEPYFGKVKNGRHYAIRAFQEKPDLVCRDPVTGTVSWKVPGEKPSEYPFCVSSNDLITYQAPDVIRLRDARDGKERWRVPTAHSWDTLPACVLSDGLLFRWENRTLTAHRAGTGGVAWQRESGPTRTNMAATQKHLWLATEQGKKGTTLLALEKATGKIAWSEDLEGSCAGTAVFLVGGRLLVRIGKKLRAYRSSSS